MIDTNEICSGEHRNIHLRENLGHIHSGNILSKPCLFDRHSSSAVFQLEASQGQQINITMVDFGQTSTKAWGSCVNYGRIVELQTNQQTMICGGGERTKHLMISNSNKVEISLQKYQNPKFMLRFEGEHPGMGD